jgi:single-strand DNA-binding protein
MNKAVLVGNLTRDPELSTAGQSGISVCRFSIAINRKFKNAEGNNETDFFNIVAWRQLGENVAKFMKKGSKVCVVGQIQNRNYDDKDGNKRYVTEIIADEVEFLTRAGDRVGDTQDQTYPEPPAENNEMRPVTDDSLPF